MNPDIIDVALNIKRHRKILNLTLDRLAEKSGVTKGLISQIENFRTSPSLSILYKIASSLNVTPADLLKSRSKNLPYILTRHQTGEIIEREFPESGFRYQTLAKAKKGKLMDPFLLTIPPHSSRKSVITNADEFIYLLAGKITFKINNEELPLKAGDSLYFEGELPHSIQNNNMDPASLLVLYAYK